MNILHKLTATFTNSHKTALPPLDIKDVAPAFWWSGLDMPRLQVLISGDNLKDCKVKVEGEGITLEEIIFFLNPHYALLYLNIKKAPPQTFTITLKKGGAAKQIPYELKKRRTDTYAQGFDSSDVLYLLMPDRFSQGDARHETVAGMLEKPTGRMEPDGRHGGDLQGIINHLDYFKDLGVTALWLTPVQENNMPSCSYHGYAITNYYRIDPRFGTNEEYCRFVREAHQKGLKVIMDMVFNHCGSEHPLFKDMPYHDWFSHGSTCTLTNNEVLSPTDMHAAPDVRQRNKDGWFVKSMPDWNQQNPYVADYLIQNSVWWVEYAGIDGIRQDTVPYQEPAFLARWCRQLLDLYPHLNIVGETWVPDNVSLACWQKGCRLTIEDTSLPSVMDFPLMQPLRLEQGGNDLASLYGLLAQDAVFPDPMQLLIFLENHDTNRYFRDKKSTMDIDRYKQSLTLLLTMRGIPQLWQGTEVLVFGDKTKGDGNMRKDFPGGWEEDKTNAFTGEGLNPLQREALDFTRRLLRWRKSNPAVTRGRLIHYPPKDGVYIYCRCYEGHTTTVLLNTSSHPRMLETVSYRTAFPCREARSVLDGSHSTIGIHFALASGDTCLLDFTSEAEKGHS